MRLRYDNNIEARLFGNNVSYVIFKRGCHYREPQESHLGLGLTIVICTFRRPQSLRRFLDSLLSQDNNPDELVIVDASSDDRTELMLRTYAGLEDLAARIIYFRVSGSLRGLTRQRNFALYQVTTDLVAFFDDDIVLRPSCLREMERYHRLLDDDVVGIGAYIENQYRRPTLLWRIRLKLRMVQSLRPGTYHRSGISMPWSFLAPTDEVVQGDWLHGGGTMWKTAVVREIGFDESFSGYAQGEDLELSLRAGRRGKLMLAGAARLEHLHERDGRPDHYTLGYMAIYNRYQIHRRMLENRTWRDAARFIYAWTLDTLMLTRHLFFPSRFSSTLMHVAGRIKAAFDILSGG